MDETQNAVVESASISIDRGFACTVWLVLDYGGVKQGFGGYLLSHTDHAPSPELARWVVGLMKVFGVSKWDELQGKPCRVVSDNAKVYRVGHLLKDVWFDPEASPKESPDA